MSIILPCPFCDASPTFDIRGEYFRGGCKEHLPAAVMQPVDMPEQVIIQWNAIVTNIVDVREHVYGNV